MFYEKYTLRICCMFSFVFAITSVTVNFNTTHSTHCKSLKHTPSHCLNTQRSSVGWIKTFVNTLNCIFLREIGLYYQ